MLASRVGACSYVNRGQQVNLHGTVIFYTPKSQYNWLNIHVLYQQRGFWRITSIRILILHLLTHLANDAVFPSRFTIILQFNHKHSPFWISFYIIYQHTFHVFLPIRASEQHSAPYIIRFLKIFYFIWYKSENKHCEMMVSVRGLVLDYEENGT